MEFFKPSKQLIPLVLGASIMTISMQTPAQAVQPLSACSAEDIESTQWIAHPIDNASVADIGVTRDIIACADLENNQVRVLGVKRGSIYSDRYNSKLNKCNKRRLPTHLPQYARLLSDRGRKTGGIGTISIPRKGGTGVIRQGSYTEYGTALTQAGSVGCGDIPATDTSIVD